MTETFKYKNLVSSADFNSRFSDILKVGVLRGFYFQKGTGDFDLTLTYSPDESSALVTSVGVKIEEKEVLDDVIIISPNNGLDNRFDNVYAKYKYGTYDAEVTYVVDEGVGTIANPIINDDEHTLLGTVEVLPNENLSVAIFHYPTRGVYLEDIANNVVFKEKVILEKGAEISTGSGDEGGDASIVTRKEVYDMVYPFTKTESFDMRGETGTFDTSRFYRNDGSLYAMGKVIEEDVKGRISKIEVTYYAEDSVTETRKEIIALMWDDFDNITSKEKL